MKVLCVTGDVFLPCDQVLYIRFMRTEVDRLAFSKRQIFLTEVGVFL